MLREMLLSEILSLQATAESLDRVADKMGQGTLSDEEFNKGIAYLLIMRDDLMLRATKIKGQIARMEAGASEGLDLGRNSECN